MSNKIPRIFSYALWAIVLVRLIIPFSISSTFSIFNAIPSSTIPITQGPQKNTIENNISSGITQEKSVVEIVNNKIQDTFLPKTPKAYADPIQILLSVIVLIWFIVATIFFLFSILIYLRTVHKFKESVIYKNTDLISECCESLKLKRKISVYISDGTHTPVVCGLIKTRIIIPSIFIRDCNELELKYIITHELVHIKRFDYITKPMAVLALCVHWFNPVIWLSFKLAQKDMEMSCDQKVISVCDEDIRKVYAASLINLAVKQNTFLNGGLLAFGESNIKSRIKGIMKYKRPGFGVILVATVVLVIFGAIALTNPGDTKVASSSEYNKSTTKEATITPDEFLKTYDLKVKENPEKSTLVVPKNWDTTLGQYTEGLFWKLANVYSKDAGLDLNGFKGSKVEVYKYSLTDGLPGLKEQSEFKYPSNAILLVKENKVVGAWLAFNVNGIGPSVKRKYISDITGLDYEAWVQKEGIFSDSGKNKDLETLGPIDVLKAYFKAIESGDKVRAHACESPIEMQNTLITNLSGSGLYNTGYSENNSMVDNIIKAKPISFKLMDATTLNEVKTLGNITNVEVAVTMELQWKDNAFDTPDGKDIRFVMLKKYNNGWKLSGLGTGP